MAVLLGAVKTQPYRNINGKKYTLYKSGTKETVLNYVKEYGIPKNAYYRIVKNGNKLFDTTNKAIINGNTIIGQIDKVVTWIDTSHQNNFVKMNSELEQIKTISTNGYTELLKRTDATNQLLDTLIGATAEAAAKPINISGKRVSDVMKNVSSRVYGIAGA
jgi:hypothetical protein